MVEYPIVGRVFIKDSEPVLRQDLILIKDSEAQNEPASRRRFGRVVSQNKKHPKRDAFYLVGHQGL